MNGEVAPAYAVMTQFTMLRHVQSVTTDQVTNNTVMSFGNWVLTDDGISTVLGWKSALFSMLDVSGRDPWTSGLLDMNRYFTVLDCC